MDELIELSVVNIIKYVDICILTISKEFIIYDLHVGLISIHDFLLTCNYHLLQIFEALQYNGQT